MIDADTTARACKAAVWIALVEAQRACWPDVVERLYSLHVLVDDRVRRADYDLWQRLLVIEGPNQPPASEDD